MINHPLIKSISTECIIQIKERSHLVALKKGEALFMQGDKADAVYCIEQGTLKILRTSFEGQEKIFSVFSNQQFLAVGILFSPPYLYPATAIAIEDTKLWSIPIAELENGILSNEASNRLWFMHLNKRLKDFQQMLTDEVFSEAKNRLKKFLKTCADNIGEIENEWIIIKMSLTKQEVADLLSIRRETLSRLFTELKDEGYCEVGLKKQFKMKKSWIEQID